MKIINQKSKMNTYLFYDLETSGLNKAFDQVLQFAAIRTDMNLNEIDRHAIMVQLRPDVIPSPRAVITHRIPIYESMSGLCEYEAVRYIHNLLNRPGTISIGYNSLGFDDEFLRFSFHRNMLQPYLHQYYNGCFRMDMLPITTIYRLYRQGVIKWPEKEGESTLKLEYLSETNNLASGRAHDAMTDVEATVELARKFYKEEEMWDYITGYFYKQTDKDRTEKLPSFFHGFENMPGNHLYGLAAGSQYGPRLNYQAPVISIGNSIPYKNQTLWLRIDLPELRETILETIETKTWVIRKRYGEPVILLPPLERYMKYITPERISNVEENREWLMSNPDLFREIINYHREYSYPEIPDLDVDAALYQIGFLSNHEQELCALFNNVPVEEKLKIAADFPRPETRKLAYRVLCRNYPQNLPKEITGDFDKYMKKINPSCEDDALLDYKGDRKTTPESAMNEIADLRDGSGLDHDQLALLHELEEHIKDNFR